MKHILLDYETKSAVKVFSDRLEEFSKIEHVDKLKNYFIPKFEAFIDEIAGHHRSIGDMKTCISHFDEVLNLKASKVQMNLFQEELERKCITGERWD